MVILRLVAVSDRSMSTNTHELTEHVEHLNTTDGVPCYSDAETLTIPNTKITVDVLSKYALGGYDTNMGPQH